MCRNIVFKIIKKVSSATLILNKKLKKLICHSYTVQRMFKKRENKKKSNMSRFSRENCDIYFPYICCSCSSSLRDTSSMTTTLFSCSVGDTNIYCQ